MFGVLHRKPLGWGELLWLQRSWYTLMSALWLQSLQNIGFFFATQKFGCNAVNLRRQCDIIDILGASRSVVRFVNLLFEDLEFGIYCNFLLLQFDRKKLYQLGFLFLQFLVDYAFNGRSHLFLRSWIDVYINAVDVLLRLQYFWLDFVRLMVTSLGFLLWWLGRCPT